MAYILRYEDGIYVLLVFSLLYLYFTWNFNHWKNKGIKQLNPHVFIGNLYDVFSFKITVGAFLAKISNEAKGKECIGFYIFRKPGLVIRSSELIKAVLVKDFQYFKDRSIKSDIHSDPIGSTNLFFIKSPHWRQLRVKLSPVFTSGKMKQMFSLIDKIGNDMTAYVRYQLKCKSDTVFEVREFCAKFTTDSIASIAFGIEADSFKDPDALFRNLGRKIFDFNWFRAMELASVSFAPELAKVFKCKTFSKECTNIMRKVFFDVFRMRETNTIERHDLIDTLIKLKSEKPSSKDELEFEGDVLVAQAAVFFVAGYETTSSTMSYTLYELIKNPDLQKRLFENVMDVLKKYGGVISYDAIQEMNYLDMCIKETLRIYPSVPFLDRICAQKYKYVGKEEVTIEAGTPVFVSVLGLQNDPENFPNPKIYDPERFSPNNINKIKPFTYLPFGDGPRNCIGERFGLLQSKVGLVHIIKNFEMLKCKSTPETLTLNPRSLLSTPMENVDIVFKPRM